MKNVSIKGAKKLFHGNLTTNVIDYLEGCIEN